MKPYYADDQVTLFRGRCENVLTELPDASVDSVVTDPPYGLNFMGKHWDTGAVAFDTTVWGHCLRVLKPGGHLLAFGGTRTWHRLAVAVEDAGFEMRDSIAWIYGSGFPKSLDVSKAIDKAAGAEREVIGVSTKVRSSPIHGGGQKIDVLDQVTAPATPDAQRWQGWGTALKPAFEPVVVARKPLAGTVAANVLAHGTGALNIDGCRVEHDETPKTTTRTAPRYSGATMNGGKRGGDRSLIASAVPAGRWPSNVLLDPDTAAELDKQSGNRPGMKRGILNRGATTGRSIGGDSAYGNAEPHSLEAGYDDEGGASRFFPVFRYSAKAPTDERPTANGIAHPTVKPLDLMRWLVRLVTPPNGVVLEPFAGSGTTAEACIHEHMRCIAIEREADYLPLIVARLTKPMEVGLDFGGTS